MKWRKRKGKRESECARRRLRPRSATRGAGRACAGQGRWAHAALAARRRSGACGRDEGKEREREKKGSKIGGKKRREGEGVSARRRCLRGARAKGRARPGARAKGQVMLRTSG